MFYHLVLLGPDRIGFHTVTTDPTIFAQTKTQARNQLRTLPVSVAVHLWQSPTIADWQALQTTDPYFSGVSLAVDLRSFCQQLTSESGTGPTPNHPNPGHLETTP